MLGPRLHALAIMDVEQPSRARAARAFAVSWLAYASYYLGRKGLGVVKSTLARELGMSDAALAAIDTSYLVAYAAGQVPSGVWVDRVGPRRVLCVGLCVSACACAGFSASSSGALFALLFAINGLAQSTGWPAATKVMAQWIPSGSRGRNMGAWSTCYQVGGVAGTALATWLLAHYGWRAALRGPALWLVLMAFVIAVALPVARSPAADGGEVLELPPAREQALALRSTRLYRYGACYFCVKLIRYSLLFWLPYYLHTGADLDEISSGYVSTAFEVGGALGSAGLGLLSDRYPHARARVASASLLLLAAAMAGYAAGLAHGALQHCLALALLGALLFGPDALISGVAAQDAAGSGAAATAVGLVNGLGSAGAIFQGVLTVSVQHALGWGGVFEVFVGLSLMAAATLWVGSTTLVQGVSAKQ